MEPTAEIEENWRRCEQRLPLSPVEPAALMAPQITAAIPLEPSVVRVVLAHGESETIEPLLDGPVFGPLRDRAMFERVEVDELGDTIIWPTGADLDPDVIYGTGPPDWQPSVHVTVPQQA